MRLKGRRGLRHSGSGTDSTAKQYLRRQLIATLALVTASLIGFAPAASAHDVLVSSNPSANSVQATPPTEITLTFNEAVEPVDPQIAITVGQARPVVLTPTVDDTEVKVSLSGLPTQTPPAAGSVLWKVGYRIVSADGHPVTGLLTFSVGHGPAAVASTAAPNPSGAGWVWIVVGVALLVIIVVAVLLLQRMRSRREAAEAERKSAPITP